MKTTLYLGIAVLTAATAQAQILRPEAVNRTLGRTHARPDARVATPGHRGEGYGHRESPYIYRDHGRGYAGYDRHHSYVHRSHGSWSHYYPRSYGHDGYWGYRPGVTVRYYPSYDYYGNSYPAYGYGYAYPGYGYTNYGTQGLFWGGLAGAIIGHNSGTFRHDAWRGAAWGAGVGWLLGTVADANRRAVAHESPVITYPAATVAPQPAASAQPPQVTIINNYYNAPATPMSAANGLFGRP